MPSETDPLLPSYAPAPEINNPYRQKHYSSEINYGDPEANVVSSTPETWKQYGEFQRRNEGDEDDDTSNTLTNGMAKIFRSVFALIWFLMFVALGLYFLRSLKDGPEPPLPPGYRRPHTPPPSNDDISERVKDILTSTPLIDGHDDFAFTMRRFYNNTITSDKFKKEFEHGKMPLHVDLPRLRDGMVGGSFWSAWVACPVNASEDRTDEHYVDAVARTIQQIDVLRRFQDQYPEEFTSPTGAHIGPIEEADESGRKYMMARWLAAGSLFGPLSIEGLHQVLPSTPMSSLRNLYSLGVRMATLTWNCHNEFADAAMISKSLEKPPTPVNGVFRPDEGAITIRGRAVLKEMNRLGMIIDISHTSYWSQKAVLSKDEDGKRITRAPVVFSHSSAYSLCPHPRNVKDDILDLVPQTRSLVMVNFTPLFISCTPPADKSTTITSVGEPHFTIPDFYEKNSTLHQVARHIVYIGDRIGYDHVGLGSDFDGMETAPKGLDGVDKFPDLVAELLKMGVSDEDVKKVVGENILRVWQEVDEVGEQMKKEGVLPGIDKAIGY